VIGRKEGDFVFPQDDFLSGRHLQFEVRGGRCVVSDLGSRNGVYLRIAQPTALSPGQMLLFGETLVRFEVN
jgi:pSer/pThr/pTyr-binding forkhead associated (FHA) protein